MENADELKKLERQIDLEKRSQIKRNVILTLIPILLGIFWILISFFQVRRLEGQKKKIMQDIEEERGKLDSFKMLNDRLQLKYLRSKGFDNAKNANVEEGIEADNILSILLQNKSIDQSLRIEYFKKTLDEEKVWLSIKELGYTNLRERDTKSKDLSTRVTNAIFFGSDVQLYDIKLITLVLLRAGSPLQTIARIKNDAGRENVIQIGSLYYIYEDGKALNKNPLLTAEQIGKASLKDQLITDKL